MVQTRIPIRGLMLLCWATVAIVVAALTTWWVLLALLPLLMMMSGMAMMGTMARSAGAGPRAGPWGWCAGWFAPPAERRWEVNLALAIPLADSWGMHGDVSGWWMIVMMPLMLLFWVGIILGIVWIARGGLDSRREERRETPTEILERRFAEGAISPEEYQERREVIARSSR